jgi:hypothetical protein
VHEIYKDAAKAALNDDSRTAMIDTAHADALMEALHEDLIDAEEIRQELAETVSHDPAA